MNDGFSFIFKHHLSKIYSLMLHRSELPAWHNFFHFYSFDDFCLQILSKSIFLSHTHVFMRCNECLELRDYSLAYYDMASRVTATRLKPSEGHWQHVKVMKGGRKLPIKHLSQLCPVFTDILP